MPFIMCSEQNGPNPLAIARSGLTGDLVLQPKQLDPGRSRSRPFQDRTAGMEGIQLFPGQNDRDGSDSAVTRPEWPGLTGSGPCGRGRGPVRDYQDFRWVGFGVVWPAC